MRDAELVANDGPDVRVRIERDGHRPVEDEGFAVAFHENVAFSNEDLPGAPGVVQSVVRQEDLSSRRRRHVASGEDGSVPRKRRRAVERLVDFPDPIASIGVAEPPLREPL